MLVSNACLQYYKFYNAIAQIIYRLTYSFLFPKKYINLRPALKTNQLAYY